MHQSHGKRTGDICLSHSHRLALRLACIYSVRPLLLQQKLSIHPTSLESCTLPPKSKCNTQYCPKPYDQLLLALHCSNFGETRTDIIKTLSNLSPSNRQITFTARTLAGVATKWVQHSPRRPQPQARGIETLRSGGPCWKLHFFFPCSGPAGPTIQTYSIVLAPFSVP